MESERPNSDAFTSPAALSALVEGVENEINDEDETVLLAYAPSWRDADEENIPPVPDELNREKACWTKERGWFAASDGEVVLRLGCRDGASEERN